MKKQQGSALILAILLLAFFMALSLNMLTISRAKAQRAGDTVIGNKVLSDSDSASTLGYYEYNLALEYYLKAKSIKQTSNVNHNYDFVINKIKLLKET